MAQKTASRPRSAASIARELGISPATVSYALNGRKGVSQDLRAKILTLATEYGIAPAPAATVTQKRLLGMILADVGNSFYSELAISASTAARELGYEVIFSTTNDEPEAIDSAARAMLSHGVSGLLLTTARMFDASLVRELRAARVKFVQISRRAVHVECGFVGIDDYTAGRDMMRHVIEHGYRRICVAVGPITSSSSRGRSKGFHDTLSLAGISLNRDYNLVTGLSWRAGNRVAQHLLSLGRLPEVVVCGSDAMAIGLINAFAREKIRVPEDVAVTGYDGLTSSFPGVIDLTTIIQPQAQMARAAVEMVTAQSDHSRDVQTLICKHELHIGHTCGCA